MGVSAPKARRPNVAGLRHVVAAGHYLAAHAGFTVLEAGGNAIDAGVAAGLATNVVESHMTGIAGIAPVLIYLKETGEVVSIDGVGTAPKGASCEYFQRHHGGVIEKGSMFEMVVPGTLDAWLTALERYGTLSFAEVAEAAIRLARDGFPMYPFLARLIAERADITRLWPDSAAIYLPDDRPPVVGEVFVQSDLARTLQFLADEEAAGARRGRAEGIDAAREAFYRGDIAAEIGRFFTANGGLLGAEDMAAFRVEVAPPAGVRFAETDVFTTGPWSTGPMMLQALNLLQGFDLAGMGHNTPDYIHTVIEAIKIAAADREAYYGDPRFVDVPIETLLSADHADVRRALFQSDRALPAMPPPGEIDGYPRPTPPAATGSPVRDGRGGLGTSYVCAVDSQGNAFSATTTDGALGSPVVPGTGISPTHSGRSFYTDPAHPACVAPGKRPRTACMPALAIRKGRSVMPFGTPGSDVIPQAMLQVFLNVTVFGMLPQEAIEAPRFASYSFPESYFPHDNLPGVLRLEEPVGKAAGDALAALGHTVEWWPDLMWRAGSVSAILMDEESGIRFGGADPRRTGYAVGW